MCETKEEEMGGRAGGKDVRTRKSKVTRPGPSKTTRARKLRPAEEPTTDPVPANEQEAEEMAAPTFVAAKHKQRRDGNTDWSEDELLLDQEFGFKWKQHEYLKQRVKEMTAAANELKDELLGAMEIADLMEVAVEDRLVKRYKQEVATASEEFLLQAGVPASKIAEAKALSLKAYRKAVKEGKKSPWRLSASRIGGEE
jgi:hypothetical protein